MEPRWLQLARAELASGVYEIPGPGSLARIEEYQATCTLWPHSDDRIPWCSSFVNAMIIWAGLAGTDSAAARSWLDWGIGIGSPPIGAIVVLQRGKPPQPGRHITKGPGHVGFYLGLATPHHAILLGGNQSNSVRASIYPLSKALSFRWPGEDRR